MLLSVTACDEYVYTILLSFDNYELCLSSLIKTLFNSIQFVISKGRTIRFPGRGLGSYPKKIVQGKIIRKK